MMNTIRVLLVEEVRLVRELLKSLLNDQPDMHVAARIHDAKAALVRARELHPHIALIGSLQPEESRLQLVRSLRATVPEARVVVMDFWGTEDRVAEFVQAGAHAFILKDTAAANLLHVIRFAASGGAPPVRAESMAVVRSGEEAESGRAEAVALPAPAENGFAQLTQREREISVMISHGHSNKEIARELNISLHTVKAHVRGIMGKLALRSRVEIAAYAFQDRARSRLVTLGLALVPGISATDMAAELLIGFQALFGLSLGSILA